MKIERQLLFGIISLLLTFQLNGEKLQSGTEVLSEGNNKFALDLYSQLKSEKGNIFFSPYSISTCLGMVYAGAKNNTEKQIATVFHFTDGQEQTCKSFGSLQGQFNNIQKKENIKLNIANAIWAKEKYELLPGYLELVRNDYKSKINLAPFDTMKSCEKTRREINWWVEEKTNDKIKELIKKGMINPLTIMVLVNAIYFKGNWASQFKKRATNENGIFFPSPETKTTVPMMFQSGKFKYGENKETRILEMPYKGNETSMLILLPKEKGGIRKLEKSLKYKNMNELMKKMETQKVKVYIPKFKAETSYQLGSILKKMGMPDAFTSKADFSGMDGTKNLFISKVIHKAFVEVDEKGTEAAAATAVIMERKSMSINRPPVFKADHPFIFMIRENSTGSILFMGRMSNPGQ